MKARELMTSQPEVVVPSDRIERAAEIMRDADVGFVPVVDDRNTMKLQGVITDRDIAIRHVAAGHERNCQVQEHMTSGSLEAVKADEPVERAMEVMQRAQVRRVPVVEADGRLVGVIAQADVAVDSQRGSQQVAATVEKISEPARPKR